MWVSDLLLLAIEILNLSSEKERSGLLKAQLKTVVTWGLELGCQDGRRKWSGWALGSKSSQEGCCFLGLLFCTLHPIALNLCFFICVVAMIPTLLTSQDKMRMKGVSHVHKRRPKHTTPSSVAAHLSETHYSRITEKKVRLASTRHPVTLEKWFSDFPTSLPRIQIALSGIHSGMMSMI